MRIINDCHIGTTRQAGTTPVSQAALTEYIHACFKGLLPANLSLESENFVTINGDLFDGFTVDPREVLWTYQVLSDWLDNTYNPRLALVAGNHDWSPKADRLSSFHMLAQLLLHRYPDGQVTVHDHTKGFDSIGGDVWAIPHMPNQDQFDVELGKALACPHRGYLLLHANFDNNFAADADHSLNVSMDQAMELVRSGWKLIFAHEHQQREPMEGVIVVGNQFPTSVADCLNNASKRALSIKDGVASEIETWSAEGSFIDVVWNEVDGQDLDGYQFVRVSGAATAEQAEAAILTVNNLRKRSTALVVSNAVKVEGLAEMDQLMSASFEDIQSYDVLSALCEELTEAEVKVVRGLLA